jgi:hypothetical protein
VQHNRLEFPHADRELLEPSHWLVDIFQHRPVHLFASILSWNPVLAWLYWSRRPAEWVKLRHISALRLEGVLEHPTDMKLKDVACLRTIFTPMLAARHFRLDGPFTFFSSSR